MKQRQDPINSAVRKLSSTCFAAKVCTVPMTITGFVGSGPKAVKSFLYLLIVKSKFSPSLLKTFDSKDSILMVASPMLRLREDNSGIPERAKFVKL
jgi:hypothetical protein